ncbi:MAG: lamin tail domain-containing protein, partial [Verrucomicrobiota bacterium]
ANVVGNFGPGFGLGDVDGVVLRDPHGQIVDQVKYRVEEPWPSSPNGSGPTLSLRAPGLDNARPDSWIASENPGGTPGATNGTGNVDLPPVVEIIDPVAGAKLNNAAGISVTARVSDPDGAVVRTTFFANGFPIGVANEAPFEVIWTPAEGIHHLSAQAEDDGGNEVTSSPVSVLVVPPPSEGLLPFLESGGKVVIEAEHFTASVPSGEDARVESQWVQEPVLIDSNDTAPAQDGSNRSLFEGNGYMTATPNEEVVWLGPDDKRYDPDDDPDLNDVSPMLSYDVGFTTAGSYMVWIRGFAEKGDDNSAHIGINGVPAKTVNLLELGQWTWRGQAVIVPEPGVHTVNIWMREDGFSVDRLVLELGGVSPPPGEGPAESERGDLILPNSLPTCVICKPLPKTGFFEGAVVPIKVQSLDVDGATAEVEFFANGTSLGVDRTAPYGMNWTPAAGAYDLVTVATDIDGGQTRSTAIEITVLSPEPETFLVINEINYNDSGAFNTGDWIELFNPNTEAVDLTGWRLGDNDPDNSFVFPHSTVIPGEGYLVVSADLDAFLRKHPATTNVIGNIPFGFGKSGDTVLLLDSAGREIDRVDYLPAQPWPVQANGLGKTLVLGDHQTDNNAAAEWRASQFDGGTPGRINHPTTVAIHAQPIVALTSPSDGAVFPSGSSLQLEAGATDDGTIDFVQFFAVRNNGLPESLGIDKSAPYAVGWTPTDGRYFLTAVAVDDLGAITTSEGIAVSISDAVSSARVVINELNYNSPAFAASDAADWIEFHNPGETAVDLTGWTVRDAQTTNAPYRFPVGATIESKGYLVVARDLLKFQTVHPSVASLGPLPFGLGREDSVTIYNPTGDVIDTIAYRSTAPWPSGPNGKGSTLTLIYPTLDNGLPENWIGDPPDATYLGSPGADNGHSDLAPTPTVTVEQPVNGTTVSTGDSVPVTVSVVGPSLPLVDVALFVDTDPNDTSPPEMVGAIMTSSDPTVSQPASFDFTWIPPAIGDYYLTAETSESNGRKTKSDLVKISVNEISGFAAFAASSIPAGLPSGFGEDADNDGESNGAEYARGTDPNLADSHSNRTIEMSEADETVVIRFGTANVSDISWTLLRSPALGDSQDWKEIFRRENGTESAAAGISVSRDPDDASILIITDSNPHNPRGFYMLENKLIR